MLTTSAEPSDHAMLNPSHGTRRRADSQSGLVARSCTRTAHAVTLFEDLAKDPGR